MSEYIFIHRRTVHITFHNNIIMWVGTLWAGRIRNDDLATIDRYYTVDY